MLTDRLEESTKRVLAKHDPLIRLGGPAPGTVSGQRVVGQLCLELEQLACTTQA